ncbi:MAG: hypothetical protein ACLVJO_01535 [[Clostridium] scindens]
MYDIQVRKNVCCIGIEFQCVGGSDQPRKYSEQLQKMAVDAGKEVLQILQNGWKIYQNINKEGEISNMISLTRIDARLIHGQVAVYGLNF